MKKLVLITLAIALALSGCGDSPGSPSYIPSGDQTPAAADYNISGTGAFIYNGSPKTVTITPKAGKSSGQVTVKYNGSTTLPMAPGSYAVTFDVAKASGWKAATGLSARTLTICDIIIDDIDDLEDFLSNSTENDEDTPYFIALNINDEDDFTALSTTLQSDANHNKYVYLDLSGSTVTTVPRYAFETVRYLTGITIPDSVTAIEGRAFRGTSLASVIIPNRVTTIEHDAFSASYYLTSVTIGSGVTHLGKNAFNGCENLTSVTFAGTIPSNGFSNDNEWPVFPGDLRAKFYATNKTNGTPGTYTTSNPGNSGVKWTRQ